MEPFGPDPARSAVERGLLFISCNVQCKSVRVDAANLPDLPFLWVGEVSNKHLANEMQQPFCVSEHFAIACSWLNQPLSTVTQQRYMPLAFSQKPIQRPAPCEGLIMQNQSCVEFSIWVDLECFLGKKIEKTMTHSKTAMKYSSARIINCCPWMYHPSIRDRLLPTALPVRGRLLPIIF